ncbi:MAG: protoporphyrinogen oxidase [Planctomycetes bacterium]|nr:protoporphyrinogen oxidase [Planctomycetota bacterium]
MNGALPPDRRIVVVGGGIGGLATAFRLRQRLPAARITVIESAERWGGVVRTTREAGCVLEHGPDSILRSKPAGMALIADLGLEGEVQTTRSDARRSLIARGDRLLPVPEGFYLLAPGRWRSFLASGLVSWPGTLRMAMDLVLPRRAADAPEESLAQLVRRRLGREALERLAQPMIGGIYTADPEQLSIAAAMPQLARLESSHRSLILAMRARASEEPASGARYGLFASLRGGLGLLIERLVERLQDCDLRLATPASGITRTGDSWNITTPGGHLAAEQLVIAGPAHTAARLLTDAAPSLAQTLASIPYASVATINLAWPASALSGVPLGAGFVVPAIEGCTVIAATFAHQKYDGRVPEGHALIRAFVGGALHPRALAASDDDLVSQVLADLGRWLRIASPPVLARVHRWPDAMAQYTLGHRERLAAIRAAESELPGLALVGNGYEGVGIPDLCQQAEAAAVRLGGGG